MVVHQNITNLAGYFNFLNVRKIPYVILIYNHYRYLDIIYTLIQVHVARTNHATYRLVFLAYLLVFLVNSLAYLVYTLAFLAFFSWNISCIIFGFKNC